MHRSPQAADPVHPGAGGAVAGYVSFTEITDPGAHRAYNAWHQLDHLPEQRPLPGLLGGERWVATPACAAASTVGDPALAGVHYFTLYLMGEPLAETLDGFRALARALAEAGRFHAERRSLLAGPVRVSGAHAAPRTLVSAAAVPFRPSRGVYVVVEPAGATPLADRLEGFGPASPGLVDTDGVAGTWVLRADPALGAEEWAGTGGALTVCFLDAPPLAVAPALGDALARSRAGAAPARYAGPFETIVPWRWDWFDDEPADGAPEG